LHQPGWQKHDYEYIFTGSRYMGINVYLPRMKKQDRLKELQRELDVTYQEMNDILERNGLRRRNINRLPKEDYQQWNHLNSKSITLISEFSALLKE
jgi:hypothetical protein